ncbi:MAG TPA: DUF3352 domain-containing protein [Opitutaceae bacterium]|nr:DUF3352 domain-containing protein [Opitutaceae bacterium]
MNSLRRLWLGTLGLSLAAFAHANSPITHIASDDAALIIAVHDVPTVLSEWDRSAWAKTWNDDQVKKFFAPLRAEMDASDWSGKFKEKTGYTLQELLGFATGDAVLILDNANFALEQPAGTPPVLIGIDVGDNASKLESVLTKAAKDENALDETSDFSGVVVHTLQPNTKKDDSSNTPTIWAIVDGKLVLSPSRETLLGAIDAIKNGSVHNPWDNSERYAKMQQRSGGDSHFIVSVNAATLYPTFKALAIERAKANPQNNPLNLDPEALLSALGLDTFREFYMTGRLHEEGTEMHAALLYSEAKGLMKLFAYHDGPPATPPFISAKWNSVSTAKFSLKEAFTALEEILENFSPPLAGLFQGQLRSFNKQLGIDIKRDLFGSMGDSLIASNITPADLPPDVAPSAFDMEQFFAFSLEDTDAFSKAVTALQNSSGPNAENLFKTRDYLGEKIVSFNFPAPAGAKQRGIHYSITKGYFLMSVGSAAPLETALQTMSGGQPTLWEKPEIKAALSRMPERAGAFSYQDMRTVIASAFQSLAKAASVVANQPAPVPAPADSAGENEEADSAPQKIEKRSKPPVDPTAIPDLATISKYWDHSVGFSERDSSGVYITSQIVYPK